MSNLLSFTAALCSPDSWFSLLLDSVGQRSQFLLAGVDFHLFQRVCFNSAPTQHPSSFLLPSEPGTLGGAATVRELHVIGGDAQREGVRIHQ